MVRPLTNTLPVLLPTATHHHPLPPTATHHHPPPPTTTHRHPCHPSAARPTRCALAKLLVPPPQLGPHAHCEVMVRPRPWRHAGWRHAFMRASFPTTIPVHLTCSMDINKLLSARLPRRCSSMMSSFRAWGLPLSQWAVGGGRIASLWPEPIVRARMGSHCMCGARANSCTANRIAEQQAWNCRVYRMRETGPSTSAAAVSSRSITRRISWHTHTHHGRGTGGGHVARSGGAIVGEIGNAVRQGSAVRTGHSCTDVP